MKNLKTGLLLSTFCVLCSCTEPGETTGIGAATGGVLGAGVGAIIGSQSGNAGAGLAVGALVGSGTGAYVGNAIEAQQKAIRTQDEAIERQDAMIRAQSSELQELRRANADGGISPSQRAGGLHSGVVPKIDTSKLPTSPRSPHVERRPAFEGGSTHEALSFNQKPKSSEKIIERDLARSDSRVREVQPQVTAETEASGVQDDAANAAAAPERGKYAWQGQQVEDSAVKEEKIAISSLKTGGKLLSADCQKAQEEVSNARDLTDTADQLFHYRRALRLCPDNAAYHNRLGEIYLKLDRKNDAQFEFKEALAIDPELKEAQDNLKAVK